MSFYNFADISHHKGDLDIQTFADAGHRIVISKASDSYNLPDRDGRYNWSPQNHTDSRFVQNFVNTRKVGLIPAAYHFCRFDRPLPLSNKSGIVIANLDYFQTAIKQLPAEYQDIKTAIIDMEQSSTQLQAAGLSKATVSGMARDIVELFATAFDNLILYSGSWWSDQWLTTETTEWMAERMGCWEPEYVRIYNNRPLFPNYRPSVPKGFSNEYALTADDFIGKLVAWQFSDLGRFPGITSNIDLNQTMMPKEELYKLFGTDGAVDPPGPVEPPDQDCTNEIREILDRIIQFIQGLRP